MKFKRTEQRMFNNVRLSVTKHRDWNGCDICKEDTSTQCFMGWMGDVLWICGDCFKKTTSNIEEVKE